EQEFYRECGRLVETLAWPTVVSVGGPEVRLRAQLLRETYRDLISDEIPSGSLTPGNLNVGFPDQESCHVTAYSSLDPIAIPKNLMDLLPYFDGRPTEEVLKVIRKEKRIKLDPKLLRKLLDFRILVASERAEQSGPIESSCNGGGD
ncbi:MAG TPA: hypothetical protein VMS31_07705, partial [Pyrinomonadaceae bacterium]|nr:hypothetical protein [Pyrinomonadaceae bacterium]